MNRVHEDFKHIHVNLKTLVGHANWVRADARLADVYDRLRFEEMNFIAVLEGDQLLGLCSRTHLGTMLGQRYGFSLYHKQKVKDHLIPSFLAVTLDEPITDILTKVMGRKKEMFFDDVALTDMDGRFIGLIRMRTLIALQSRFFLENIETLKRQQAELDRKTRQMEGELELAGHLQQAILTNEYPRFPPEVPEDQSLLRFHHIYRSAALLGGDFFHITQLSDTAAGIFICDVSGHGVKPALVTSMIRALLTGYHDLGWHPGRMLTKLNEKLLHMLEGYQNGMFATTCYILIDLEKRNFKLGNAGHPPPIRLNRRTDSFEELIAPANAECPPIGILEGFKYNAFEGSLEEGDLVFFFTDGIYEVFNDQNEMFGRARLRDAIKRHMGCPHPVVLEEIFQEARGFSKDRQFDDDICLMAAEIVSFVCP